MVGSKSKKFLRVGESEQSTSRTLGCALQKAAFFIKVGELWVSKASFVLKLLSTAHISMSSTSGQISGDIRSLYKHKPNSVCEGSKFARPLWEPSYPSPALPHH